MGELVVFGNTSGRQGVALPAIIAGAGQGAKKRFLEFFTVNIRNPNTRADFTVSVAIALGGDEAVQACIIRLGDRIKDYREGHFPVKRDSAS